MSGKAMEIVVKAGERRTETLRMNHRADAPAAEVLRIVLEPGSVLDLEELHEGRGDFAAHLEVDVQIGRGARMRHVAVVDDSGEGTIEINRQVRLAQEARLEFVRVGSGASLDRESLRAGLMGARSRFRHGHLMMADTGRRAELDLEIAHHARHAESESLCRCVLGAESHGGFTGRILIPPDGQGADARLRNDNLLLDESARMETRPELEVYADEVQCAHGAATGALDEAALFYLRTRGLPPDQARAMLVRAFASSISNDIEMPRAQKMADGMLSRALRDLAPLRLAA
ncbi:MAG: SufD family Fe-S cluster assembly protein [Gammaproteobacteria bacterium]|nr:SufD family Fe-S cluster assembly protein [Gammaproteobacteria bacterium]